MDNDKIKTILQQILALTGQYLKNNIPLDEYMSQVQKLNNEIKKEAGD